MAGTKGKSGGARSGTGPKPRQQSEEIKLLFDKACPVKDREAIIKSQSQKALEGDLLAARFVFERLYGTPLSGDQIELQEKLEAQIADFFKTMEKELTPGAWREIVQLFGLEESGAGTLRAA